MVKKIQTKAKSKAVSKCTNNAPSGLIPVSILSTQSLARVKYANKKRIGVDRDKDNYRHLTRKFI